MAFPAEQAVRAERAALIDTLDSLTDEEFESGPTLCSEWAPRDVLAHLMGIDTGATHYFTSFGNVHKANAAIVADARSQPRDRLMHRARHWAAHPALLGKALGPFLIGDLAMHHQDILRGLGRTRDIPPACRAAILREGYVFGIKLWATHRIEPTDGGFAFGRGQKVRGTCEALGLWLAGREGLEDELEFEAA